MKIRIEKDSTFLGLTFYAEFADCDGSPYEAETTFSLDIVTEPDFDGDTVTLEITAEDLIRLGEFEKRLQ